MKPKNINSLIESLKELNNTLESLISKLHLEAAKVGYIFITNKENPIRRFKWEKKDLRYFELLRSVNKYQN